MYSVLSVVSKCNEAFESDNTENTWNLFFSLSLQQISDYVFLSYILSDKQQFFL